MEHLSRLSVSAISQNWEQLSPFRHDSSVNDLRTAYIIKGCVYFASVSDRLRSWSRDPLLSVELVLNRYVSHLTNLDHICVDFTSLDYEHVLCIAFDPSWPHVCRTSLVLTSATVTACRSSLSNYGSKCAELAQFRRDVLAVTCLRNANVERGHKIKRSTSVWTKCICFQRGLWFPGKYLPQTCDFLDVDIT